MAGKKQYLSLIVMFLGLISLVIGAVFIGLAVQKESWMADAMRQEQVTLGLTKEQISSGELIDNAQKAQSAADILREHRRSIAPTYNDLMAASGGKFDPTNPKDLTYAQALNMENYLYLGVLGFGVTTLIKGVGAALIVVGIGFGVTGLLLRGLSNKTPAPSVT